MVPRTKWFLVISLAVVFACSSPGPSPTQARNKFQEDDHNGDGRLSRDEFSGPPQAFNHMDQDGNGFLTPEEVRDARSGRGGPSSQGPRQQNAPMREMGQRQMRSSTPAASDSGPNRFVDTHVHLHPLGLDIAFGGGGMGGGMGGGRMGRNRMGGGGMDAADRLSKAADNLVSRMDSRRVSQALVVVVPSSMQGPEETYRNMRDAVQRHPDRLRLMAGGAILGTVLEETDPIKVTEGLKKQFKKAAEKILEQGAVGFGEMISYHLCMTQRHSFKYVPPNHPLFLLLSDIAAAHNVPIDLHMEAVETAGPMPLRLSRACNKNPAELKPTIPDFEDLLRHNRNARIVWQHIGWDNTGEMRISLLRRLLSEHPNLYLSLRVPERILDRQGRPIPNRIVDATMHVTPEWKRFIEDFQDRLVMGADEFIGPDSGPAKLAASFDTTWALVDQLPEEVANKIGGDNARRIYRLQ